MTIPGLSAKSGGPTTCTMDIMEGLYDIGAKIDLLTVSSEDNIGHGRPWLKEVSNDYKTPLAISKNIQRYIWQNDYNLYHANTLWMGSSHDTCRIARKKNKPYILSPHGMLYPTALEISSWKKRILLQFGFKKDIMMATCLHATCQQEAEYCRKFGYKGPIAIVPNAVVISKDATLKKAIYRDERGRRQIGFLGRLHPIKMVEQVLYALAKIKDEGIGINEALSFQIMGQFDKKYEQWLRDEVKRLGLLDCVTFVGTVSGREKYERLSNLSALMVPSIQENFGMIVPEALICGTPVYASFGTPWNELIDYDAGWWRNNEPETIACVIKEIMSLNDDQLLRKGRNGRELIEKKYDQHKVARMMMELYEWCIFNGERPAFVMVD